MMPSSSPSATSSETSTTMCAPPRSSPRLRVARIGGFIAKWPRRLLFERLDRWLDVARRGRLQDLRVVAALRVLDELHLEHRLQHRVVFGADALLALRRHELPTLERGDHAVDARVAGLRDGVADHLRGDEAVRREDVRNLAVLLHPIDEPGVHRVLRRLVDVMRDKGDARNLGPEHR